MAFSSDYEKYLKQSQKDEGEDGEGTNSGGKIEFHDFVSSSALREDQLSPLDKKRLLATHQILNEQSIKKQKERLETYQKLKEGKTTLTQFRQEKNANETSFSPHPTLSNEAQFSGSDKSVNQLPNDNEADTNNKEKNELHYKYELQNRPQQAPRSAPKPSPFGSSG